MTGQTPNTGSAQAQLSPVPRDQHAEESVVGSLLLEREAIVGIAAHLRATDFFDERCAQVYAAALSLFEKRVPADVVTLHAELCALHGQDAGTRLLTDAVGWAAQTPTASHVKHYAQLVVEAAARRALISTGGSIAAMGYSDNEAVRDLFARAQNALASAYERASQEGYTPIDRVAGEFYDHFEQLCEHPGQFTGIPTGFPSLDRLTGGLQRDDLIILAARPAQGKTTLALNIAYNAANRYSPEGSQYAVGIFSLEMSRRQLMAKLVAMEARVPTDRLRTGSVTDEQQGKIADAVGHIAELPIYIEDKSGLTISELRSRAAAMQQERGLDMVVVDYLQLVAGTAHRKDGNRAQEVGEVSRGLKTLARELGVPVLACCQLNREIENRTDKTPQLSDLRESGSIEADADIVAFIQRQDDVTKVSGATNIADLYVRKHRNGETASLGLYCDLAESRFHDLTSRTR
jgi:replicative DNA helicase